MTSTDSQVGTANEPKRLVLSPFLVSFVAGGTAGAVSRTVVSPFERMKIIFQVQQQNARYAGVLPTLARMWNEEGWRGFMRGNGSNCVRVVPYSAVQFCSYTYAKSMANRFGYGDGWESRVVCGMVAGATSVTATYPLDLVRTRLSVQTAQISSKLERASLVKPPGMWTLLIEMYRTEGGIRALYRGLTPTTLGIAPYVGINFAAYEYLNEKTKNSLFSGALSGFVAQSLTYPFDILRRRFQVRGLGRGSLGYNYTGTFDALRQIVRHEGWLGLYKGYVPHTLKVVPSMAASFWTFETVKRWLTL